MQGKLICIEGIDLSGKGTQAKKLLDYLKTKENTDHIHYPDESGPIGKTIYDFLHKKFDFNTETQFLLFFADMLKDRDAIREKLANGINVVLDRYFMSTAAYQGLNILQLNEISGMAETMKIPKPDIIVYIKISPETAAKRMGDASRADRLEEDINFQKNVVANYEKLAQNNFLGKWIEINGEKSKDEVFEQIKNIVDSQ